MGKIFADIGELGWSLYLSAHTHWLRQNGEEDITVITSKKPLFPDCKLIPMPDEFYKEFSVYPAGSFGRFGVADHEIRHFFKTKGYELSDSLKYCHFTEILDKTIYKPYSIKSRFGEGDIVVFPRCREHPNFAQRNLSKEFYELLMKKLCEEFVDKQVISVGKHSQAYDIPLYHTNYLNMIGNTSIQDLIDICTNAKTTIGGTSAPPKIALLQGTPSYVIGHEKQRFLVEENWMKTEVEFWEIPIDGYDNFKDERCIESIVSWIKNL